MKITATEFKNRLGKYLSIADKEPVIVQKSGRAKSVLLSHAMYERFRKFELEQLKEEEKTYFASLQPIE